MAVKKKPSAQTRPARLAKTPLPTAILPRERVSRARVGAIAIALFGSTLLLYWPTTSFEFVNFDDDVYITNNSWVLRGLNAESIVWAFRSTEASNWHPFAWLSHMLDVTIWGASPEAAFGHHLSNVLLHAVNATLLFLAWQYMTRQLWPSALIAALFAYHPLRVESVAWVAERKDLLAGMFWFLAILAYVWYTQNPSSRLRYLSALACFALGLMSKPMLVTLPCVLLLLDYWPLRRLPTAATARETVRLLWPLVREKLPMLGLVVASSTITFLAQQAGGAVVGDDLPLSTRLSNAIVSYQTYIRQHIWPLNLAVFYPLEVDRLSILKVSLSVVLLLVASAIVLVYRRRAPYLTVGWLWYLGTLVPVIGIVQVGGQAHADRYTYIPSIGLYVMVAWAVKDIAAHWPRAKPWVAASVLFLLATSAVASRHQMQFWQNGVTLFQRAAEVSPYSALAWNNLGSAQLERGQVEVAIESFRRAWEIRPMAPLANNLAWLLATHVDANYRSEADAVRLAEMANQMTGGTDPTVLDTLAAAYASAGRFDDAVMTADLAIEHAQLRNDQGLIRSIHERRALYLSGEVYRDPTTKQGVAIRAPAL